MAAGKDQPLHELQPHLDTLEVGQEAEGEGEDGQVVVGQVQPLKKLQPHLDSLEVGQETKREGEDGCW